MHSYGYTVSITIVGVVVLRKYECHSIPFSRLLGVYSRNRPTGPNRLFNVPSVNAGLLVVQIDL